jgi:hypothetical protein
MSYGLAFRAPTLALEEKLDAIESDPCMVQGIVAMPNMGGDCVENTGRPAILLWGDSHAASLAPALHEKARQAGYDLILMAKGSCPPLDGAGRKIRGSPGEAQACIRFNQNVLKHIQDDSRVQTVFLAADWRASLADPYSRGTGWLVTGEAPDAPRPRLTDSERLLGASLARTLAALRGAGKRTYVLQDVAAFATDPLWRSQTAGIPARVWLLSHLRHGELIDPGVDTKAEQTADTLARSIVGAAGRYAGANLLDLERQFCEPDSVCHYREGDLKFYRDNQHLTLAGAQRALAELALSHPER